MPETLHQFAERVLFSDSLEDKLSCPGEVQDIDKPATIETPLSPGRPGELKFAKSSQKVPFPKTGQLESETHRGILLHFFANHELLATELMALVLLKFPDAPKTFRRGIFKTLKEEQEHTKLYMRQMQRFGVNFGDLPVNDYFWKSISGMESPMDYVSRLSLTFEQANLDFSQFYAKQFQQIGDAETQSLFEKICHDEIAHVSYGLKWFRKWKSPSDSDWGAFQKQLHFPLTPSRAKAVPFNITGRKRAGLGQEFIDELNVCSHSKGRTPSVFWFNPLAECHIGTAGDFTPKKAQAELARDLENLPMFLSRRDDVLLVNRRPSVHFLSKIKDAGFTLPEIEVLKNGDIDSRSSFPTRKLKRLCPWGWSPDSVELFRNTFKNVTEEASSPDRCWNDSVRALYSKSWSAEFLREFLQKSGKNEFLCGQDHVGKVCTNLDEALTHVHAIRESGHSRVVVKAPFGMAGQGMIRLFEETVKDNHKVWIARTIASQQAVVVEPWLDRAADFSLQLEMTGEGLKTIGYTRLFNDVRGQFQGILATPHFFRSILESLPETNRDQLSRNIQNFENVFEEIREKLETRLESISYSGPVGIDAFLFFGVVGSLHLKPIVEINPRFTMGRLTLELMRNVSPGSSGLFQIVNRKSLPTEQDSLKDYAESIEQRYPLEFHGSPKPKIREGAITLTDPTKASQYLAIFKVSRDYNFLLKKQA